MAEVLKVANAELGTKESPAGSNLQKYGEWYGLNGAPWCAMFVSWVFAHAGKNLDITTPKGFAYVPYGETWARAHNLWSRTGTAGDIPIYDFYHYGYGVHTGIMIGAQDSANFVAIEGNTSQSSQDNGGEVQKRVRPYTEVRGFIQAHKLLFGVVNQPSWLSDGYAHPTLQHGAKGGSVSHCQRLLARHGYNIVVDGVFGDHTTYSVRRFQDHQGLTEDGVVGVRTWGHLHQ